VVTGVVVALAAVSVISVIATVWIEDARQKEQSAREREADALQKERSAREREAEQRRAAQLYATRVIVNRGLAYCQAGEVARGILWLSRGLEVMPPEGEDTLGRAIRANLAGWSHELRSLKAICAHPAEGGHIFSATFSPDGRTIFSGSEDGTARLWRSEDGTPLRLLPRHPGPIEHVTLGPDGRIALTASENRAHLWDLTTGQPLRDSVAHASKVIAIAFSLDGKEILTTTEDGKVHVVSLSSVNSPRTIQLTNATNLTAAHFAPDAKRLLTGESSYQARVWDVTTGRQLGAFLEHRSAIRALAFSPDGRKCVSGDDVGISRIWTVDGGQPIGVPLNHRSHVWCAAFSPDGRTVITGSDDRTVQFWDASTGQSIEAPLELRAIIRSVAFSPDGATFLVAGQFGQIWHWGVSGSQRAVSALGHPGKWVTSVAFSHDGTSALTAGGNPLAIRGLGFPPPGFARLWDVASGRPRGDPILFDQTVISAALSPDGSRLLTGCGALYTKAGGAYLHSLTPDVREVIRLDHDNTQVWAVAFSPDGRMLATGSFNNASTSHIGDARLWDAATGRLHKVLRHPGGGVVAIAFSPDGRSVVTGGNDRTARFWETASGEPTGPVLTHDNVVLGAAFSPDGRTVITCSIDFTARIWDRATGAIVGMPFQHNGWIRSVSFSPDGKTVLTAGGLDNAARLWDVATGLPVGPPVRHGDWVLSAAFAPDGRSILTGSKDTTARVRLISAPLEGAPETISLWARVTTGMTVEQDDVFRPLKIQEWQRSSQLYRESERRRESAAPE
jgi:WD40 repeat protein